MCDSAAGHIEGQNEPQYSKPRSPVSKGAIVERFRYGKLIQVFDTHLKNQQS